MLTRTVYLDGAKLRRLRILKGFTVRGLAEEAGISTSTITVLERRKRNDRFHPPTLVKLADALGVDSTELIGEED